MLSFMLHVNRRGCFPDGFMFLYVQPPVASYFYSLYHDVSASDNMH